MLGATLGVFDNIMNGANAVIGVRDINRITAMHVSLLCGMPTITFPFIFPIYIYLCSDEKSIWTRCPKPFLTHRRGNNNVVLLEISNGEKGPSMMPYRSCDAETVFHPDITEISGMKHLDTLYPWEVISIKRTVVPQPVMLC